MLNRVLLVLSCCALPAIALADPVCLHPDATVGAQLYPSVAVLGDTVAVAWQDSRDVDFDVYLTTSLDGAASFGNPVKVNDDPAGDDQMYPDVAFAGDGTCLVVWQDKRSAGGDPLGGDFDTYLARCQANGVCGGNVNLHGQARPGSQVRPKIAAAGTRVAVAWQDNGRSTAADQGVAWDVYYSASDNDGSSFAPAIEASDDHGNFNTDADIAITSDGAGAVTWYNWSTGAWLSSFDAQGGLTARLPVDSQAQSRMYKPASITVSGGRYLVWQDSRHTAQSVRSDLVANNGIYWDLLAAFMPGDQSAPLSPVTVNGELALSQFAPALCGDGQDAYVCYASDHVLPDYRVLCALLPGDGSAPGKSVAAAPRQDDDPPLDQLYPACGVTTGHLVVCWQQQSIEGDFDIFCTRMARESLTAAKGDGHE